MRKLFLGMFVAALVTVTRIGSAQAFDFSVEHQHTLRNCRGTLSITADRIEYKTNHKEDSRSWKYVDIREIKIDSPTELEIVSYEDQKLMFGRDRIFKFKILQGQISSEVSALLMASATRPVATSVMPETGGIPVFEIPVKHLHTFGGCAGTVRIYSDRVTYESSDEPSESRYWRYADIQNFGHPTRYRFEITTFEDKFGGPTQAYNFELKQEFPETAYDYLWVRLHPSNFYPYEKTATQPEASPPLRPSAAGTSLL